MTFCLYLTGAPATGKTTLASALRQLTGADVLSYGAILTERLGSAVSNQADLRTRSATVIRPSDVEQVDEEVGARIRSAASKNTNVVVDSHAVTAETYGFRVVPYEAQTFRGIGFTHIVCLTLPPERIAQRLGNSIEGRRMLSEAQSDMHANL